MFAASVGEGFDEGTSSVTIFLSLALLLVELHGECEGLTNDHRNLIVSEARLSQGKLGLGLAVQPQ